MTAKIFIDGAAGTTGLEIHERLGGRGDLRVVTLDDASRKDAGARKDALNDADVVILCLPDDAAREAVSMIIALVPLLVAAFAIGLAIFRRRRRARALSL